MRRDVSLTSVVAAIVLLLASPPAPVVAQEPVIKPGTTRTTRTIRLAPPSGVVARQLSDGRIEVRWARVPGAASYRLHRSVPNLSNERPISPDPQDTVYIDTDVKAGYHYYYLVAGIDEEGSIGGKAGGAPVSSTRTATSTTTTATTTTGVAAPMSVWASQPYQRSALVQWQCPPNACGTGVYFQVERAIPSAKSAWQLRHTVRATGLNLEELLDRVDDVPAGTRLVYRVTTVSASAANRSTPTTSREFTTGAPVAPGPVRELKATLSPTTIDVAWSHPDLSGILFRVFRRAGTSEMEVARSSAPHYAEPASVFAPGTSISYRVSAYSTSTERESVGMQSTIITIPTATAPGPTAGTSPTSTTGTAAGAPVGSLVVSMAAPLSVVVGGSASLTGAVGMTALRWVSLDEGIAAVDGAGTATGRAAGRTQILAIGRASDGSVRVTLVQVTVTQ